MFYYVTFYLVLGAQEYFLIYFVSVCVHRKKSRCSIDRDFPHDGVMTVTSSNVITWYKNMFIFYERKHMFVLVRIVLFSQQLDNYKIQITSA